MLTFPLEIVFPLSFIRPRHNEELRLHLWMPPFAAADKYLIRRGNPPTYPLKKVNFTCVIAHAITTVALLLVTP